MGARRILRVVSAAALAVGLAGCPALASPSVPERAELDELIRTTAARHLVPPEALLAITLSESGRLVRGELRPWPWTLNVAGRGYFYDSQEEACRALTGFMRTRALKNIDAGVAQTNLGWHGHRFVRSCDALDPTRNLNAAARILRDCYLTRHGSWLDAAACYHHPRGGAPARKYRDTVKKHLATLARRQATSRPAAFTNIPARTGKEIL
ncbi:TPA: lytic transglycosylase domain-containing protein [Klebsiella oxytoca]|nr:lytic transglycosylase domain-containing protein [Klebsiella oxytoca]